MNYFTPEKLIEAGMNEIGKASLMFFKKDCMGCHAYEVACKQEYGLGVRPRLVRVIERTPDFIPIYCHHCAKAPCKEACPFGAMQFDEETEVAVKCDLCIERLENNEQPACSKACTTGGLFWGDTKQLSEKIVAAKSRSDQTISCFCH